MKTKRAKRKRAEAKKETAAGSTRNLPQMQEDTNSFIKKFKQDIEAKVRDYRSYASEFNKPKANQHSRRAKQIKKQD